MAATAIALVIVLAGGGGGGSSLFVGGDLHSLAADPSDASHLFVGGHEGVAATTDGGRTWAQMRGLQGADAMGWAFMGRTVFVAGHPGLFRSDDAGRTFRKVNEQLPASDIHAVGGSGDNLYLASPAVGVAASTDGGKHWELRSSEGRGFMGRILVDQTHAGRLLATDMQAGVVESVDGGRTWQPLGAGGMGMWLTAVGGQPEHLIVSGMGGASETSDGGRTWHDLSVPAGATVIEASPADATTLFAAGLSGSNAVVWASKDGGRTWHRTSR